MQAIYDVPAPAKLNLFLHVVGQRADGYHLLQSVFTLIDWADTLHFEYRSDGQLRRHDQGNALPADDLCLRAARLLQTHGGRAFGADITIEKRLPAGAGMGGGSSDAATTLLALNRLWGLNWPRAKLLELGLRLGADVPFFIGGSNALVEGIGEILHPIKLPPQIYAVLKPPQSIATQQIFSSPFLERSNSLAILIGFPECINSVGTKNLKLALSKADVASLVGGFGRNDLQKPAEACCPEVVQALALLETQFGNSRMTGSGSAVFARVEAQAAKQESMSNQASILFPPDFSAEWLGRICLGLEHHPLQGWAED
jgi:4-diphosphocytidyl-2-C-methyl-D-erythritol kinase